MWSRCTESFAAKGLCAVPGGNRCSIADPIAQPMTADVPAECLSVFHHEFIPYDGSRTEPLRSG
jgi:hypothetical protein